MTHTHWVGARRFCDCVHARQGHGCGGCRVEHAWLYRYMADMYGACCVYVLLEVAAIMTP